MLWRYNIQTKRENHSHNKLEDKIDIYFLVDGVVELIVFTFEKMHFFVEFCFQIRNL